MQVIAYNLITYAQISREQVTFTEHDKVWNPTVRVSGDKTAVSLGGKSLTLLTWVTRHVSVDFFQTLFLFIMQKENTYHS